MSPVMNPIIHLSRGAGYIVSLDGMESPAQAIHATWALINDRTEMLVRPYGTNAESFWTVVNAAHVTDVICHVGGG